MKYNKLQSMYLFLIFQKFQLDAYHRQTDLTVRLTFNLAPDTQSMQIEAVTMREKINEKQRYAFEELLSFIEIAFKK